MKMKKDNPNNQTQPLVPPRMSPRFANPAPTTTSSLIKPKMSTPRFRTTWMPSGFNIIKHRQATLKISLRRYEGVFRYGPELERRTCIMSAGETFSWTEESALVSWVGLSAGVTKFVISIDTQLAMKRNANTADKEYPPISLTGQKAVCSMGDTSGELRRKIAARELCLKIAETSGTGPFAVVCLAPDVVEDLSHECQQDSRAIRFLMEKLKNRPALTVEETIKTAVCALKYLFGAKFNSSEIQVWGYGFFGVSILSPTLRMLPNLVEDYLASNDETTTSGVLAVE